MLKSTVLDCNPVAILRGATFELFSNFIFLHLIIRSDSLPSNCSLSVSVHCNGITVSDLLRNPLESFGIFSYPGGSFEPCKVFQCNSRRNCLCLESKLFWSSVLRSLFFARFRSLSDNRRLLIKKFFREEIISKIQECEIILLTLTFLFHLQDAHCNLVNFSD